jgi:hypothetical protein
MSTIDWKKFPQDDLAAQYAVLVLLIPRLQSKWPSFTGDCCPAKMLVSPRPCSLSESPLCKSDCIFCPWNRTRLSNLSIVYSTIKRASAVYFDKHLSVKVTRSEYQQRENTRRGKDAVAGIDTHYADQLLFVRRHIDPLPVWQRELLMTHPLDELLQYTNDEIIRRGLDGCNTKCQLFRSDRINSPLVAQLGRLEIQALL